MKPEVSAIWICTADDPQRKETLTEYLRVLSNLPYRCDLTIIGNGAARKSARELERALRESQVPGRIVSLHRDCDESTAIQVGLKSTQGSVIALLPPYLQTDPNELERMVDEIKKGSEYVASWRCPRVDSKWNSFKSSMFNRITRWLTGIPLHDINSSLRVMKRNVSEHVPIYGDLYRFLPILAAVQGFRVTELPIRHVQERTKKGDYRLGVYLRRVLDLLTLLFLFKFTRKPLRFFGLIGSGTLGIGAVMLAVLCVQRLLGAGLADRPALVLAVLLVVLGVQLFSLGLLGELIIFTHGRSLREPYVEAVYESNPQDDRVQIHGHR